MSLKLITINRQSTDFAKVKYLFKHSFPKDEQIPLWYLLRKAKRENLDFWGIYDDNRWVGLTYCITYQRLTYVFFLAIDPNNRSKGYGSQALTAIKQKYAGNKLALIIEEVKKAAPNYEQRLKRKQFYLKNEFIPAVFTLTEGKTDYELLMYNGNVDSKEYVELMANYGGVIFRWYIKTRIHPK
ncbi:GNAT family N-acetyltransferase [Lentilactobacillus sp. SPB1-3]|uniref:GNAT family N-acetyltransferase n=1 Tax=Lentilactobacillus terminaliae TaxID=3003483 RepID=A0ACD5DGD4_9LACO|nr:GNAT family N-acetyltransferase [Lentilactobacillus sp. SPB1-3]MCZ0976713.1 GNAT family N-acetyltransferase [Lentilactobacillus sp. SPB1-3]